MKIVLASASPRRKELLQLIGLNPEVIVPDIDEMARPAETIDAFLERVTMAKSIEVYKKKYFSHLLVSADTVVLLGGFTDRQARGSRACLRDAEPAFRTAA